MASRVSENLGPKCLLELTSTSKEMCSSRMKTGFSMGQGGALPVLCGLGVLTQIACKP